MDRGPQAVSRVAEGDERSELALDAAEDRGTRCVSVGSATADWREQFVTKDRGVQHDPTPAAVVAMQELGKLYVDAGYPEPATWQFQTDESDRPVRNELCDRGMIESCSNTHWRLTRAGVRVIMDNCT